MKLLVFSDLHSNKVKLKKLISKIKKEKPDLVINAGDTSDFGDDFKKIAKEFKKTKIPMLIIPGNHESPKEIKEVSDNKTIINLHKKSFTLDNTIFFGYGTGGFAKREEEFELISKKFRKTIKKDSKIVLITHGPPYRTKVDLLPRIGHRGCFSYTHFLKMAKPVLHVCGHFHETQGVKDKFDKTLIINPGPDGVILKI